MTLPFSLFIEFKSSSSSNFIYTYCKTCHPQDLPYQAVFAITLSDLSFLKFLVSNISLPHTYMFSSPWSTLWLLWPTIFPEYYHFLLVWLNFLFDQATNMPIPSADNLRGSAMASLLCAHPVSTNILVLENAA